MAQNLDDIMDDSTEVITDPEVLTVGFLRDALAAYNDDDKIVFPYEVNGVVTDLWLDISAILYDDVNNLVGIAVRLGGADDLPA